jgi:hypothetical protein
VFQTIVEPVRLSAHLTNSIALPKMGSDRKSSRARSDKYRHEGGSSRPGAGPPTYSQSGGSVRGHGDSGGHPRTGSSRSVDPTRAHRSKHGKGVLVEEDPSAATAKREADAVQQSGYTKTKEQLFKTTPCTGAMYIILTLLSLETVGIIFLAV